MFYCKTKNWEKVQCMIKLSILENTSCKYKTINWEPDIYINAHVKWIYDYL